MSRIRPEIKPMPPAAVCAHFGIEYCTVNQAMARLGLSRARVRELIEQGRLGVPKQQWGRIVVQVGRVERFERRTPGRKGRCLATS